MGEKQILSKVDKQKIKVSAGDTNGKHMDSLC